MQRTIADAEASLAELGEIWSSNQIEPLRRELAEVRTAVGDKVAATVEDIAAEADAMADLTDDDLDNLEHQAAELVSAAQLGTISARDLHAAHTNLASVLRASERRVAQLTRQADVVADAEADPIGYFDRTIHEKFPLVRPDFSW